MKIVIAGGTGGIGVKLIKSLEAKHDIIILSRSKDKIISKNVKIVNYSNNSENWCNAIDESDVIINLVGESINKRWSKKQKKLILNSRLNSVDKISKALDLIKHKPRLIINASAIGYYDYSNKRQIEGDGNGRHFLSNVCMLWENKVIEKFSSKSDRLAILRIGVVLDSDSGILSKLSFLFKYGLGAIIGNGKQSFSWIDIQDVIGAINYIINSKIEGPVNLTAPSEDTNYSFSKSFGKIFNKPVILRIPKFCIQLILGEMAQIATNGLNIYPKILLDKGYKFKFCNIDESIRKNYTKD
tara:strand:- start:2201 stop:3097 length:897 start_codon:yes stop_codon:yes gene_type:complete